MGLLETLEQYPDILFSSNGHLLCHATFGSDTSLSCARGRSRLLFEDFPKFQRLICSFVDVNGLALTLKSRILTCSSEHLTIRT